MIEEPEFRREDKGVGAAEDLAVIEEQERVLRFQGFDAETAWTLGNVVRRRLLEKGAGTAGWGGSAEVELAGHVLFGCATLGATPGQADWIRRKRNTVRRFARSSYAVGRMLERDGESMQARHGLELRDYAAHGGGVPLWVEGVGCVGSVVVSGMPQREDHELAVAALAEVLGVKIPALE